MDNEASVTVLIHDITESKVNPHKIINHNESLEQLAQNAVDANQPKSAFVANIKHEIRTPLNSISGMLELFK